MGGPRYQYIVIITTAYWEENILESCTYLILFISCFGYYPPTLLKLYRISVGAYLSFASCIVSARDLDRVLFLVRGSRLAGGG